MRISQLEIGVVCLLIGYIAFYTHPAPKHIQDFLSSPVGNVIFLAGLFFVTVYKSLIIGVFMAIAYIMTVQNVTEYLDPKEQTQPKSAGVAAPHVSGALKSLLKGGHLENKKPQIQQKGDKLVPAGQQKGTLHSTPPPSLSQPKPVAKSTEHFASV